MKKLVMLATSAVMAFAIATGFSTPALAYVPSSRMVLSRMVREGGRGAYSVDQDVTFTGDKQQLVLHEHWVIENAELMHLVVSNATRTGAPVHLEITYRGNKRTTFDAQGAPRTIGESSEFVESFLYTRTSGTLLNDLIRQQVLPRDFVAQMRPQPRTLEQTNPEKTAAAEPYMQLERVGGTVNYAMGDHAKPGLWVEQDSFLLRRIRFPSLAQMQCDRNGEFALGLRLPRERTITWGPNTASIHLTSVRSIKDTGKVFAPESGINEKAALQLPELASVKEFYSRFR